MDIQKLLDTAYDCGVTKAAMITQEQIVTNEVFRSICESNQCGGYGRCWMCPPHIGPIQELMAEIRRYPKAMLFQTIHEIEDSYDIEGMFEAGGVHAQVSQKLRDAIIPLFQKPYLLLSCGGCHLCETCAIRTNEPCRFPDKALASLEGYGVDVYNTTKDTDLKYINGQNTVTYFGMVLFSE